MHRTFPFHMFVLACGSAAVLAGCAEDPKDRIKILEQDNLRLAEDLNACRGEMEQLSADKNRCDQALADAMSENNSLRTQLANAQKPQAAPQQPDVAPGWTPVPGGAMLAIDAEVLFPAGQAVLRPGALRSLDSVIQTVNSQYPNFEVVVYGHTDTDPIKKSKWKDNFELSSQRSLSVVRYLQERGVSPTRLVAAGCGEHRPVAPNDNKTTRAKNRRVEVYALDPAIWGAG